MIGATECEFESRPYPPYSPDMTRFDLYLFQKRRWVHSMEAVKVS